MFVVAPGRLVAQAQGRQAKNTAAAADKMVMRPLALRNVTVVDVETGRLVPKQTVVVVGKHVQSVGAVDRIRIPANAQVIDARGKYMIPGLWDMHVHSLGSTNFLYPYFITRGVTGVVEMSSPWLDSLLDWRREIAAGTRIGPRSVVTGGFIGMPDDADQLNGSFAAFGAKKDVSIGVTTVAEARQAVQAIKATGADFVKIHSASFPREIFFAIAAEARRIGIPLAGHLADSVTPAEASDSGQRSLEHVGLEACRRQADEAFDEEEGEESTLRARCAAIAERLTRNNTWVMAVGGGGTIFGLPQCSTNSTATTPANCTNVPPAWTVLPVIAGTDLYIGMLDIGQGLLLPPPPDQLLGQKDDLLQKYPLQHMLEVYVSKGMTPLQALRTATLNPARALRATDSLGTVTPGKLADLVLLTADPLADIRNTTKIDAVVANGRYFDRAALDGLVTMLGQATAASPYPSTSLFNVGGHRPVERPHATTP